MPGVATGAGASPAALCHRLAMTSKGQTALEQQFKAADIRIFSITFPHTTASIGVAKEIGFVALKSNNLMYFEEQNELHRDPQETKGWVQEILRRARGGCAVTPTRLSRALHPSGLGKNEFSPFLCARKPLLASLSPKRCPEQGSQLRDQEPCAAES